MTILSVTASARAERSLTRQMAAYMQECWGAYEPDRSWIHRDVGRYPPKIIDEAWIAAAFTPDAERSEAQKLSLAESDRLIDEIAAAQIIVIAAPLYNYGMPAALKAWVDQIVRLGRSFTFDLARGDKPIEPIFSGKTLVLLTSCGEFGFEAGEEHLVPHFKSLSKYLGAGRVHHIGVEYQEFRDERHERSRQKAFEDIQALVADLNRSQA